MKLARTILTCTILVAASALVVAETKEVKGDTTEGWLVWNVNTGQQLKENLTSADGWLQFKYDRAQFVLLLHITPLMGLKEMKVVIKSDVDTTVAFAIEDQDKAKFHYPVQLKAGQETTVTIKPEDFRPNNDSPTKKETVQSEKLGNGYIIGDLSVFTGAMGENTLHIKQVTIVRD